MPRIDLGYDIGNQTLTPQKGVPNTQGLNQSADAMQRLAFVGADTIAEFKRNADEVEMGKQVTDAAKRIEEKTLEFKHQDNDYFTQEKRYGEFYKDMVSEYENTFDDTNKFNQFKQRIDKFAFDKGLEIKSSAMSKEAERQKEVLDSMLSDASGIALRGDQEHYSEVVTESLERINHFNDIGVLTDEEAEATTRKFNNDLSRGKVRQDITADPNAALENIRNNEYAGLSAEEQSQFEAMALSQIEQKKNKSIAEAKKQSTELVSDITLSLENGYVVTDEELAAGRVAAAIIGKSEDLEVAYQASRYITLPKATRDGLPGTIEGVNNAELRKALEVADETIERELDKDGYSFAVRQRVVDEIPLSIEDPRTIQARLAQTEYLKQHYGRAVSPLTEAEADELVDALPMMAPKQKVQLAQAFGPSEAIWEQLDKKNAGLFAMAGAVGDPQVMESIFRGQQLIKDGLTANVSQADYLPEFNDTVEDIYTGKDRKQMLDAALAYYAATTNSDAFDSGDFEDAIEAVSGGIGKINGHKLELPRGTDEDDFEDYIDNFSAQTVGEFGGVWGMSDERAAEMIQDARIVSYAVNQYRVVVDDGAVLMAPNGKPFLLSFDPDKLERDRGLKPKSVRDIRGGQ